MTLSVERWRRAWREAGGVPNDGAHAEVVRAWSEPHRRYHTPQHLGECLDLLDTVRDSAQRPAEIELALWFHDVVYDGTRKDNEERSAQWACAAAAAAGIPRRASDAIHALVMATKHDVAPTEPDAQLLVDIDLAILGAPWPRFAESSAQVREEYIHLADAQWREGRIGVLRRFLARPRLYGTQLFYEAREGQARANLQRALEALEG